MSDAMGNGANGDGDLALEARDLVKRYGSVEALRGASFSARIPLSADP